MKHHDLFDLALARELLVFRYAAHAERIYGLMVKESGECDSRATFEQAEASTLTMVIIAAEAMAAAGKPNTWAAEIADEFWFYASKMRLGMRADSPFDRDFVGKVISGYLAKQSTILDQELRNIEHAE